MNGAVSAFVERKRQPSEDRNLEGDALQLTDTGNAHRLVAREGERIRYVAEWRCWIYCDANNVWQRDTTFELIRLAQKVAKQLFLQAAATTRPELAKDWAKHAVRSQSRSKLNDAIELARAEPGITISVEALDADPFLISARNGLVDLRTGRLISRTPAALVTKCVDADFDPDADCPRFLAFLDEIMCGNADQVQFLRRLLGYSLFGGNPEQRIVFFTGVGANGKSTLLQVFLTILDAYAQTTPAESFMARRDGSPTNDLARLQGARFVSATEAENGRRLAENLVKRLTGNDRVAARYLFAEYFEFVPQFLAFLAVNHKPIVSGDDPAIWRRLLIVPFDFVVPPENRDPHLIDKLLEERDGIFTWAVAGFLQWQSTGLAVPAVCVAAADEYREQMDTIGTWIEDSTLLADGVSAKANELYTDYAGWCRENGHSAMTSTKFGLTLADRGFDKRRTPSGMTYRGIGLLSTRDREACRDVGS